MAIQELPQPIQAGGGLIGDPRFPTIVSHHFRNGTVMFFAHSLPGNFLMNFFSPVDRTKPAASYVVSGVKSVALKELEDLFGSYQGSSPALAAPSVRTLPVQRTLDPGGFPLP